MLKFYLVGITKLAYIGSCQYPVSPWDFHPFQHGTQILDFNWIQSIQYVPSAIEQWEIEFAKNPLRESDQFWTQLDTDFRNLTVKSLSVNQFQRQRIKFPILNSISLT